MKKKTKNIPFEFALDYLEPLHPVLKPMFGYWSVYIGGKIVLILREHETHRESNGVWISTTPRHHESMKQEIPSMCSISLLTNGKAETNWQMIPADANDFESSVRKVCEMILKGDKRIGKYTPLNPLKGT